MFKIVAAIVLLSVSTLASSDDAESGDDQYRQILQKSILRKNGDVEVSDFLLFQLCHGGADQPPAPDYPAGVDADCDGDSDVDHDDLRAMYEGMTGPRLPR